VKWLRLRFLIPLALMLAMAGLRLWPHASLASRVLSSTVVYADHGELMRITLAGDEQYRLWTPLDAVSPQFVEALLLHEDQYFYWHPGVNPVALARAAVVNAGAQDFGPGASTLSMQLARRLYGMRTRSVSGKLGQMLAAVWLELRYSKRDILETHINLLPYGQNVQGVGAASLIYFGKPAAQLTLAEALALVVIPQAPRLRDPGAGETPALRAARLRLLARWQAKHAGDAAAARLAREPLSYRRLADLPFVAPHVTDSLLQSNERAREIHSTIDLSLQRLLERRIDQYLAALGRYRVNNAVAMLVDVRTLEVKAAVGSARYLAADIEGQVNGTQAKRSPGSALKPFIYALAMDQGLIHPRTVLKDAPMAFGPYSPENFDGAFKGPITAEDALVGSRNVPAVALAARLSQPSLYQFLRSAGVSRMASERHYGLALALGGGEVTMEEVATLYAMLGNGGELRPLRYTRAASASPATRVLSREASFMVLDMLTRNPRPDGLGEDGPSRSVAWKTGTSWGFRDAWTAGLVDSYVLVVWIGNFDGSGNPAFVGIRAAAPLFLSIADALESTHSTPPAPGFTPTAALARVAVCAASGDLPNADCPQTAPTWYVPGRSPIRVSTVHRRVRVDTRTGKEACVDVPTASVREEVYEYWPSDLAALFARAGVPRRRPPEPGDCGPSNTLAAAKPAITSPTSGAAYEVRTRRLGADALVLTATADGAVRTLYWFVDSAYVGASAPSRSLYWTPSHPGRFDLSVVDDHGASDARKLEVELLP
jgi:penicillin-binding protein 1C